jgi:GntR family carbon starvation induced transcriptional regulator
MTAKRKPATRKAAARTVAAGARRPTRRPVAAEAVESSPNSADLQASLRRDIVSCELAPGKRLKFEELRARYDAGIGSLREVLMQLVADGLVVTESNRGFCVAPVSVADLEDITELRVDIERKALTQAIQHGGDAWEAGIVAALHLLVKMEPNVAAQPTRHRDVWEERHQRFHDALVSACPSVWLMRFRHTLFVQTQRYRWLSMLQSQHPGRVNDHRTLVELALARDAAGAAGAMEEHIRHTAKNVREWLSVHAASGMNTEFSRARQDGRPQLAAGTA